MNKDEYQKLIKKKLPKEPRLKNAIIAFLVGGFLGLFSEIVSVILMMCFGMSKIMSYSVICLIMIFITVLFTSLSFFDELVTKAKCGLIIPTTGFAHSVASSAIEYRKDGLITGIGSNVFKLAGSVILYGIISSFILCIIKVIICG